MNKNINFFDLIAYMEQKGYIRSMLVAKKITTSIYRNGIQEMLDKANVAALVSKKMQEDKKFAQMVQVISGQLIVDAIYNNVNFDVSNIELTEIEKLAIQTDKNKNLN